MTIPGMAQSRTGVFARVGKVYFELMFLLYSLKNNGGIIMNEQKTSALFRFIKWCVKLIYPKIRAEGTEYLPDEPVIIVGNHCQMNGPIVGELYVPGQPYIWCAGEMMHLKDVPEYAFRDFWSQKPKWTHPFYKLISYIIAPLSECVFNNARTIGVYHDTRILSTFKNTVKKLQEGKSVVIFPEHDVKHTTSSMTSRISLLILRSSITRKPASSCNLCRCTLRLS